MNPGNQQTSTTQHLNIVAINYLAGQQIFAYLALFDENVIVVLFSPSLNCVTQNKSFWSLINADVVFALKQIYTYGSENIIQTSHEQQIMAVFLLNVRPTCTMRRQ